MFLQKAGAWLGSQSSRSVSPPPAGSKFLLHCTNFDEILTTGQASLSTFHGRSLSYLLGRLPSSFAAQEPALIGSQSLHVHSADDLPIESTQLAL